jgi:hypothetical protein
VIPASLREGGGNHEGSRGEESECEWDERANHGDPFVGLGGRGSVAIFWSHPQ